jgi:hypothetical protein
MLGGGGGAAEAAASAAAVPVELLAALLREAGGGGGAASAAAASLTARPPTATAGDDDDEQRRRRRRRRRRRSSEEGGTTSGEGEEEDDGDDNDDDDNSQGAPPPRTPPPPPEDAAAQLLGGALDGCSDRAAQQAAQDALGNRLAAVRVVVATTAAGTGAGQQQRQQQRRQQQQQQEQRREDDTQMLLLFSVCGEVGQAVALDAVVASSSLSSSSSSRLPLSVQRCGSVALQGPVRFLAARSLPAAETQGSTGPCAAVVAFAACSRRLYALAAVPSAAPAGSGSWRLLPRPLAAIALSGAPLALALHPHCFEAAVVVDRGDGSTGLDVVDLDARVRALLLPPPPPQQPPSRGARPGATTTAAMLSPPPAARVSRLQLPILDATLPDASAPVVTRRAACVYDAHPRELLAARGRRVARVSLSPPPDGGGGGSSTSSVTLLLELRAGEAFCALSNAASSGPFGETTVEEAWGAEGRISRRVAASARRRLRWLQRSLVAAVTTQRALLLDARSPSAPLLSWEHLLGDGLGAPSAALLTVAATPETLPLAAAAAAAVAGAAAAAAATADAAAAAYPSQMFDPATQPDFDGRSHLLPATQASQGAAARRQHGGPSASPASAAAAARSSSSPLVLRGTVVFGAFTTGDWRAASFTLGEPRPLPLPPRRLQEGDDDDDENHNGAGGRGSAPTAPWRAIFASPARALGPPRRLANPLRRSLPRFERRRLEHARAVLYPPPATDLRGASHSWEPGARDAALAAAARAALAAQRAAPDGAGLALAPLLPCSGGGSVGTLQQPLFLLARSTFDGDVLLESCCHAPRPGAAAATDGEDGGGAPLADHPAPRLALSGVAVSSSAAAVAESLASLSTTLNSSASANRRALAHWLDAELEPAAPEPPFEMLVTDDRRRDAERRRRARHVLIVPLHHRAALAHARGVAAGTAVGLSGSAGVALAAGGEGDGGEDGAAEDAEALALTAALLSARAPTVLPELAQRLALERSAAAGDEGAAAALAGGRGGGRVAAAAANGDNDNDESNTAVARVIAAQLPFPVHRLAASRLLRAADPQAAASGSADAQRAALERLRRQARVAFAGPEQQQQQQQQQQGWEQGATSIELRLISPLGHGRRRVAPLAAAATPPGLLRRLVSLEVAGGAEEAAQAAPAGDDGGGGSRRRPTPQPPAAVAPLLRSSAARRHWAALAAEWGADGDFGAGGEEMGASEEEAAAVAEEEGAPVPQQQQQQQQQQPPPARPPPPPRPSQRQQQHDAGAAPAAGPPPLLPPPASQEQQQQQPQPTPPPRKRKKAKAAAPRFTEGF